MQSNRVKGSLNKCDLYNPTGHLANNVFPNIHTWWENSSYWSFLVWCWPPTKMRLGAVSLFRKGWFAHQRRCTNPELFWHQFSLLLQGKKMLLEVKCSRLSNKHCVLIYFLSGAHHDTVIGIAFVTNKQTARPAQVNTNQQTFDT